MVFCDPVTGLVLWGVAVVTAIEILTLAVKPKALKAV
jgi:hypothetical protein